MALLFFDLNLSIRVRRARSRFASISAGVQYLVTVGLFSVLPLNLNEKRYINKKSDYENYGQYRTNVSS